MKVSSGDLSWIYTCGGLVEAEGRRVESVKARSGVVRLNVTSTKAILMTL
jgi:hypothetical protein